jgi:hypothetical protein
MPEDTKVDLWADENKPKVNLVQTIKQYRVEIPNQHYEYYAVLSVREDGYVEVDDFKFNGVRGPKRGGYRLSDPNDKKIWDAQLEVWGWLQEWELVELKPIGPEDSEYFATHELEKEAAITSAKANEFDKEAGW